LRRIDLRAGVAVPVAVEVAKAFLVAEVLVPVLSLAFLVSVAVLVPKLFI